MNDITVVRQYEKPDDRPGTKIIITEYAVSDIKFKAVMSDLHVLPDLCFNLINFVSLDLLLKIVQELYPGLSHAQVEIGAVHDHDDDGTPMLRVTAR